MLAHWPRNSKFWSFCTRWPSVSVSQSTLTQHKESVIPRWLCKRGTSFLVDNVYMSATVGTLNILDCILENLVNIPLALNQRGIRFPLCWANTFFQIRFIREWYFPCFSKQNGVNTLKKWNLVNKNNKKTFKYPQKRVLPSSQHKTPTEYSKWIWGGGGFEIVFF